MWKTGSRDKSTIKRGAKYKFYPTAVASCTYLYPVPICACAREKKIINALPFSTLNVGHGHHMVQHFRWPVGFVDPRAQGIDEKERIDARRGTKASNRRQSLDREPKWPLLFI